MPGPTMLRLKVRDPRGSEREVSFTQDIVTIGRAGECDLALESGFISRLHARLLRSGLGWQIADEGSKNGVFVNGQRVSGTAPVKTGDALRIGDFGVTVAEADETDGEDSERTVIAPRSVSDGVTPLSALSEHEPEDERTVHVVSPTPQPLSTIDETPGQLVASHDEAVSGPEAVGEDAAWERLATIAPEPQVEVISTPNQLETAAVDSSDNATPIPDVHEQADASTADPVLPADLTLRERTLLETLAAAGPAGVAPADLVEAVWGIRGGDTNMLDRLLARAQQKLGPRQIVRLPAGSLRLE